MAELTGKVALVTGAARGIGYAIADKLAENGADMVLFDLCPEEAGEAAAAEIAKTYSVKALFRRCDVSNFEAVQETMKEITKELGGVDILVSTASRRPPRSSDPCRRPLRPFLIRCSSRRSQGLPCPAGTASRPR